jgi:hypothetical protein
MIAFVLSGFLSSSAAVALLTRCTFAPSLG